MADTVYTVALRDKASVQAARVARGMDRVAVATHRTATAMRSGTAQDLKKARAAERLARAEMKAAQAIKRAGMAARGQVGRSGPGRPKSGGVLDRNRGIRGALGAGAGIMLVSYVKSLAEVVRGTIEAAGKVQAFHAGLTDISKGGNDVTLSKNWQDELVRLRVPLEQGRQDVLGLLAAMKDLNTLNAGRTVNDILKLGSALQLTTEQRKSFNKVFRDVAGKGKVQREELTTQLAEIGTGVTIQGFLKEVASATRRTYAEAEKMLSTGKISADIGIPALIRAQTKARGITDLTAKADQMARGPIGTLNALDNSVLLLRESMGRRLIDAGVLGGIEKLIKGLNWLDDALNSINPSILRGVLVALGTVTAAAALFGVTAFGMWILATLPISATVAAIVAVGAAVAGLTATFVAEMGGWDTMWSNFAEGLRLIAQDTAAQARKWGLDTIANFIEGLTSFDIAKILTDLITPGGLGKTLGRSVGSSIRDLFGLSDASDNPLDGMASVYEEPILESVADAAAFSSQELQSVDLMTPAQDPDRLARMAAAAGANISNTTSNTGGSIGKVDVEVNVSGAQSPEDTAAEVGSFFAHEFGSLLDQRMQAVGG